LKRLLEIISPQKGDQGGKQTAAAKRRGKKKKVVRKEAPMKCPMCEVSGRKEKNRRNSTADNKFRVN